MMYELLDAGSLSFDRNFRSANQASAFKACAGPGSNSHAGQRDGGVDPDEAWRNRRLAGMVFTVRVQGGVAYWEGSTNVVQHKGAATRMAKTAGAKKVVNNIKVSDAAKETASANLEQGRRRAQVKRGDARSQ